MLQSSVYEIYMYISYVIHRAQRDKMISQMINQ